MRTRYEQLMLTKKHRPLSKKEKAELKALREAHNGLTK
jgi:hypothetical protein